MERVTTARLRQGILTVGSMVVFAFVAALAGVQPGDRSIPYTKYVLDNGLTLIIHEDHTAPTVAINVWYHVGSKNERPGKTGFAHLFEHLMFNGSEHFDDDYFKAFDRVGATGINGTTNVDRTNYFEVVPTTAIDMALGWSPIGWAICWEPSIRTSSMSSAASSGTRNGKVRIGRTVSPAS